MESIYKLLALDLDGTLTDSEKKVSDVNKEYIKKAQDKGIEIILASGRPVIGIEPIAKDLDLFNRGGYILAYNGGHIIDCKNKKDLIKKTIPVELFHDICQINKKYEVYALTYNEHGVICENNTSQYVQREGFNNSIPVIKVDNLEAELTEPVVKFMVVGEPIELQKAYKYLVSLYKGTLNLFFSEPYFMEITPLGIEKAFALGKLCELLGYGREQLIACGDGLNDIPMLQFAGMAIAMNNAYEETKKYANYISASNTENGVAEAIKKFILFEGEE